MITYKRAFTLTEIMIVVIIIGIIAGFALPQYTKAIRKAHERDVVIQLISLHAANLIYNAKEDEFFPGTNLTISQINDGLNINIIANDMNYSYTRSATDAYAATATWDDSDNSFDFTVRVNEGPLSASNPCCSAGSCPSLPDC